MDLLDTYRQANAKLNEGLIRQERTLRQEEDHTARWARKMDAVRSFLDPLGLRRGPPIVHVAGTSGKGSVAYHLALALQNAGYPTGLHVTPYLQVATEKVWVNGAFLSVSDFASLVEWIMPPALRIRTPHHPVSPHGLASLALALEAFRQAEVDVIVLEAGCGGRFDMTNAIEPVIASVITSVGLDHIRTLGHGHGDTISSIAWHKAGVIKEATPAFTAVEGQALALLEEEARRKGAPLHRLGPMEGGYPERNLALARLVARHLDHLFPGVSPALERAGRARLAGRLERMPGTDVWLDGAHNADKARALVDCLPGPAVMVVGMLGSRRPEDIVPVLATKAQAFVACEPSVVGKPALAAPELAQACRRTGRRTMTASSPAEALDMAQGLAGHDIPVVVTGSLYLVGEARGLFFPERDVLLGRSSWGRP